MAEGHGQSMGTGKLTIGISVDDERAGIGGGYDGSGGNITSSGGEVAATGDGSDGIGKGNQ